MSTTSTLVSLLEEIRSLLACIDEPMASSFLTVIDGAIGAERVTEPSPYPLGAIPDFEALAEPSTRSATSALAAATADLTWYQSNADRVPPGWVHQSAASELIGPNGTLVGTDQSRLGLLYLSPALNYPNHWHDAEEFYLVLGGSAQVTVAGKTTICGPGAYSRTPSQAHHQIRTDHRPMLAVWGWAGADTSFDSYGF